jgi:hypothetical protein
MPANGSPSSTMTIQEAATHWRDPKSSYLKRWGETFGIRLMDFHVGHVITYRAERAKEVAAQTIDLEVDALLTLLRELHLGADIERHFGHAHTTAELSADEIESLPGRARAYIAEMQRELVSLRSENDRLKNHVRKATWARSR